VASPTGRVAEWTRAKGAPSGEDWLHGMSESEIADLAEAARGVLSDQESSGAEAPTKAYTRVPSPLQALAGAIGRRFGGLWAADLFFGELRQVRRYLRDSSLKKEVDSRLTAAVSAGCRILVGHSLGSIVAYEFVHQHPDAQLDLLLTLGSPLGLRLVREGLAEPLLTPNGEQFTGVRRWVNIYDRHDPIACAGGLGRWWPHVVDEVVDNQGDAHAVARYLSKRVTGAAIGAAFAKNV
jgi:pimeloyl-ACP methyl ester carboxylesterase